MSISHRVEITQHGERIYMTFPATKSLSRRSFTASLRRESARHFAHAILSLLEKTSKEGN